MFFSLNKAIHTYGSTILLGVFCFGCTSKIDGYTHNQEVEDLINLKVQVNSKIPLVVNVSWNSQLKQVGAVTYWSEHEELITTPRSDLKKRNQIDLIGLRPLTEYQYLVELEDENGEVVEQEGSITTGALSPYLPLLNVEGFAPSTGYTLVPLVTA